jgi:glycosyltransferase involved in cell wall biosynthesis
MKQIDKYNLSSKIKMLGYLDNSEIPLLYQSSLGLFFPSLEEGQGLPVLEAMCCKTPVVTSRNTATEEIAGGHAFLVDPKDLTSLFKGLEYLAFTEKNTGKIKEAYLHARNFTWDKTVKEIMEIILKQK